jgi:hypothetical protein
MPVLGLYVLIEYSMPSAGRHNNESFVQLVLLYLVIQLCAVPVTLVGDSAVPVLGLACSHASETLEFAHKAGNKVGS